MMVYLIEFHSLYNHLEQMQKILLSIQISYTIIQEIIISVTKSAVITAIITATNLTIHFLVANIL